MPGAYLWGWDGAAFRQVLTDAAGHLQVDVLTSALPAGGATAANQVITHGYIDGLEGLLGGGLPAALVAGSLSVINNAASEQHCYGYDGANWQTLLVESAAQKNLRVRLYAGANFIGEGLFSTTFILNATERGLLVKAGLYVYDSAVATRAVYSPYSIADGDILANAIPVGLWGYNGATWDRLRTYGVGVLKVGRAEVGLLDVRLTGTGQVGAAGARKLYWLTCNPSAGNSVFELSDDTDGSTAVRVDCFSTSREGKGFNFDPPMEFTNGIYLKTFTNITSITFGYL